MIKEKFTPDRQEACKIADDYWKEKLSDRENVLEDIQSLIVANAKSGSYDITYKILKQDEGFFKEKLTEVGYNITFSICKDGEAFSYMKISFN